MDAQLPDTGTDTEELRRRRPERRSAKKPADRRSDKRQPRPVSGWLKELLDWTKTLAVALIVVLALHYWVFNLSTVKGQSMEPTLYEGEWLFINKAVYLAHGPMLGDVVVLKDPSTGPEHKAYLVKRIVGLPGDRIEIRGGELYRNGELIVESYTDSDIEGTDYGPAVVQAGTYFVMGDNRRQGASRDSRAFDRPVSEDEVLGRADLVLWPIAKLGVL